MSENDRTLSGYNDRQSSRLEHSFVTVKNLLTVEKYDDDADREGFYVIPSVGNGVIGRYFSLRDMINATPNVIVRKSVYQKLCEADRALKLKPKYQNCQLVVAYGYRTPQIQLALYLATYEKKKIQFPDLSEEELREKAHIEIAYPEVAGHPTGGAVDVLIYDFEKKEYLGFGTEIYELDSKKVYYNAYGLKNSEKQNRKVLRTVMCEQDFVPYDGEWWHFCYGDCEWAYYKYLRNSRMHLHVVPPVALYRSKELNEITDVAYSDKLKMTESVFDDRIYMRIAIPQNSRVGEEFLAVLKQLGVSIVQSRNACIAKADNFPLEILFMHDQDIPHLVDAGVVDLGVTGEDIYREAMCKSKIVKYLGLAKSVLVLAIPVNSDIKVLQDLNGKIIATRYRNLAENFFNEQGIKNVRIISISGFVEIAPLINYADAIIDSVTTGNSLKQNNLQVFYKILDSQAVLLASETISGDSIKQNALCKLLDRIKSYDLAKQYKKVSFLVSKQKVQSIVDNILNKSRGIIIMISSNEDCLVKVKTSNGGNGSLTYLQTLLPISNLWRILDFLKQEGSMNIILQDVDGILI